MMNLALAGSSLARRIFHLVVLPASDLCATLAAPASGLSGGHFFLQRSVPVRINAAGLFRFNSSARSVELKPRTSIESDGDDHASRNGEKQ